MTARRTRPGRRASTLIFTLWLMVALAGTALYLGQQIMQTRRRDVNRIAQIQREQAIDGMQRYVLAVLTAQDDPGEMPEIDSYTAEDVAVGDVRVWLLGGSDDPDAEAPVFALRDEAGKLNLNSAPIEVLEALPAMPPELAAAIFDWRDADDELSANGAESATYLDRQPGYLAKNADFETVDEIRLLNGAEPLLIAGMDRNRNGIIEQWERDAASAARGRFDEIPDSAFADQLTVLSREPNVTTDGTPRTNLNGPAPALFAALNPVLAGRTQQVVAAAGVGGRTFTSVLEFIVRGGLTATEADSVWDLLTIAEGDNIVGRVNVNTAPATVLAALPGVGEDRAEDLVAYREQHSEELQTPLWLSLALDQETAIAMGPYVTTRSYQIVADIVAVSPGARGFTRVRVVYDMAGGSPVLVERRDLTHLGWPLGETILTDMLAARGEQP